MENQMDYVIKIDWERRTVDTLIFEERTQALSHLSDVEETLVRVGASVSSRKRVEETVAIKIDSNDPAGETILEYILVGV